MNDRCCLDVVLRIDSEYVDVSILPFQTIKKLAKTIDEQKARCALIKPGPAKKGVAVGNKAMMTPAASLPLPGAMSKVNNVVRSLSNSGKVSTGLTSPSLLSKTPVFQDSQQVRCFNC